MEGSCLTLFCDRTMTGDAGRALDILRRAHEEPVRCDDIALLSCFTFKTKAFFARVNDGRAVKRAVVIDVQNLAHKSAPGRKKRDYGGVFDLVRLCIERGHVVYAYTPLGHVRVSDDVRNADLLQVRLLFFFVFVSKCYSQCSIE